MALTVLDNQSTVFSGTGTVQHVAAQSALYRVSIRTTLPASSGLSVVIQQNGSTIVSSATPTSTQLELDLQTVISCTANDTLAVVLSSSAAADNGLNVLKSVITFNRLLAP
jgi:hypothetical protein